MTPDLDALYAERLTRYTAAMRNGQPDRTPVRPFAAEITAKYAGFTCQEVTHDYRKAFEAVLRCCRDFAWDAAVPNMVYVWTGLTQAIGLKYYGIPGIDIPANTGFQYREPPQVDAFMRPEEYDVVATLNLNGDYISDALAAQVGGIGIAPGGNIGDGPAVFEATHGTAPGFAGKNRVNPGSLILSAEMMLRYMKWTEAADLINKGVARTIANKELTYDLARLREAMKAPKREIAARKNVEEDLQRLIPGATLMTCSGFADAIIRHMDD